MSAGPEALLALWFGQAPASPPPPEVRERWFRASEAEDARLQCTFLPALEAAGAGGGWPRRNARERLARVILLDQLPRHCFRGTARAFAFDALARTEAQAFARDGGSATLRVQVLAANEGARATYEQLGFRPRLLELEKSLTP